MVWLKAVGSVMCIIYASTFLWMGTSIATEMWRDRHRELLHKMPVWRDISVISVFFVAAGVFGILGWIIW